jgi:hypothetical protein
MHVSYKGHSYIRVKGDALTPLRGWKVTLLTIDEYDARTDKERADFRLIQEQDLGIIETLGL